jgi:hypothetical protein
MDDAEFLTIVATHPLVNKSEDEMRVKIESLKKVAIQEIMAEVPDFWNRITASFTIPANQQTVDMVNEFNDYDHVKYFWTDEKKLDFWQEAKYRKEHPNGESYLGKPNKYSPLGNNLVLFSPVNSVDTTMNITYINNKSIDTLSSIPPRWHHVVLFHVLQFFDDPQKMVYERKYSKAIAVMKNTATEAEEEEIEIELSDSIATMVSAQTVNRNR